ncbi:hypothetical protein LCI18_012159 [Fusarium solani-melongenae]|uniref:Uncharacterized protein n=1 Tax=Fusarium solani subsp. cucurbitae TaxID=2747967 RepID=A0ACD3ZIV1_FUSSC|nr:hypothetical protein LCI18_012159 [Fusarium solani-melongenae]
MLRYDSVHVNPQGPGDARPTAQQIVRDENLIGKLAGKTIFITGANQGIGLETARALHSTKATLYLGVRDRTKAQQVIDDIHASDPTNNAPLHIIEISLDSLNSVRRAANDFLARNDKLNILILNAGVMCTPEGKTVDGFETQFGVNHLGHFLLFQLLKPALLAGVTPSLNSRVVSVSSKGHRASEVRFHDYNFNEPGSYDATEAYGQSKTANIYLANEIDRRYGSQGLHATSLHPGAIKTNLLQYMDREILDSVESNEEIQKMFKSATQGAATTVYAALSKEWENRGGRYLVDCAEGPAVRPGSDPMSFDGGYSPWAYDGGKAARLWADSNKMVGFDTNA